MQDSGTGYITPEGMLSEQSPGYIGTNLSGHHPVSIEVNQSLLNDKDAQCKENKVAFRVCYPKRPIKLTPTGNEYGSGPSTGIGVQCSSCHDAHENTNPKFLRAPSEDLLCIACHPLCSSGCPNP
jgi:predicted CXXCH cytochrome family protein